jgi:cell division protein FtsB
MLKLELAEGKYTYIYENGNQRALRYGEEWRDLTGDNLVYFLAHELDQLRQENTELKERAEGYKAVDDYIRRKFPTRQDMRNEILRQRNHAEASEAEVKELKEKIAYLEEYCCSDCQHTGWLENRVDGRYPCACVVEMEPYQLLRAELIKHKKIISAFTAIHECRADTVHDDYEYTYRLIKELNSEEEQDE